MTNDGSSKFPSNASIPGSRIRENSGFSGTFRSLTTSATLEFGTTDLIASSEECVDEFPFGQRAEIVIEGNFVGLLRPKTV